MSEVKELNIKNRTYYCFNDIIDIKYFQSNLLKIDKKQYKDIDIYYTGYITIKNFSDCENIHSVNPLCLIIYSATGYFKECQNTKEQISQKGLILIKQIYRKSVCFVIIGIFQTRTYFQYMSKLEAKELMTNSNLIDKKCIL